MPPPDAARRLYNATVRSTVLALRETLVRHDENLAAWTLMSEVVPHFLRDDPEIAQARDDQYAMVRHVLEPPEAYAQTYAINEHEQPFEAQFGGLGVADADRIPRVRWLADQLQAIPGPIAITDLGCNDGWMLSHLAGRGDLNIGSVRGVDLNPGCIARAKARFPDGGKPRSQFYIESIENFATQNAGVDLSDATVCFEVLEHVRDPFTILDAARAVTKPGGRMFFSTPNGAVEQGWLPDWDKVEYKGHVRAVTRLDFEAWLEHAATGQLGHDGERGDWNITYSPDGLLLGEVTRA